MQNAQTISLSHPAKPLRRWSAQDPDQACPSTFEFIGVPVSYARNEEIFGEESRPITFIKSCRIGAHL